MSEGDRDFARVDNAAAALGEHFDSVQIITTKLSSGETTTTSVGRGNWHARQGSVRMWLMRQDTAERAEAWRESKGD